MCKQIKSLTEFVQNIFELHSKERQNNENRLKDNEIFYTERNEFLYRGQSNEIYDIVPSIGRGKSHPSDYSILDFEKYLIEMAKYKLTNYFKKDMSPVERLALMQHHGIYTRLLDVTENPLVALYFACCNNQDDVGEVIVFKHKSFDISNYPLIEAIADTAYLTKSMYYCRLEDFYLRAKQKNYFKDEELENPEETIKSFCSSPLFIHAPIHAFRQQIQRGRYILFPNKIEKDVVDKTKDAFSPIIEPIGKDNDCIKEIYCICGRDKAKILNELRIFGISKEVLFCDNIDVVCKEINENY